MTTMTNNSFSFSRPSRPAYLDGLFGTTQSQAKDHRPRTPSLSRSHHSSDSMSSLATSRTNSKDYSTPTHSREYSTKPLPSLPRKLSPAPEEETTHSKFDWDDDEPKVRKQPSRPRLKIRTPSLPLLSKRSQPKLQQTRPNSGSSIIPAPLQPRPVSPKQHERKDSGPPSCAVLPNKPLPALPMYAQVQPQPRELKSFRCYYFAARHCQYWVMGGKHGDACEMCCVSHLPQRPFLILNTDKSTASWTFRLTMTPQSESLHCIAAFEAFV